MMHISGPLLWFGHEMPLTKNRWQGLRSTGNAYVRRAFQRLLQRRSEPVKISVRMSPGNKYNKRSRKLRNLLCMCEFRNSNAGLRNQTVLLADFAYCGRTCAQVPIVLTPSSLPPAFSSRLPPFSPPPIAPHFGMIGEEIRESDSGEERAVCR